MNSDTPRTDAASWHEGSRAILTNEVVTAEFCRQLERELNAQIEKNRINNLDAQPPIKPTKPIHASLPDCDQVILAHRPEFDALWPHLWKKIGPILDQEPNLHIAAMRASWIVWRASTENFLKHEFTETPPEPHYTKG